jgi:peptidoglycan/LPS O-acetylase OafA/YrhL
MSAFMPAVQERRAYRADIDGLRAIAVLAVVHFHAFPQLLPGGYVGVDVFFVISGFLITRILLDAHAQGWLSFTRFYADRARRLLPALVLVLAFVFVLGWGGLLPHEFAELGMQIAASAAFLQNVLLFSQSGYFDSASDSKPLLHLWSLGVEGQFYLLYPLLLSLAWRRRMSIGWVIAGLFCISFALNIVVSAEQPIAAFYLPHTRMWQLMAGCALAALRPSPPIRCDARPGARREACGLLGLAALGVAFLTYSPDFYYPGWPAVVPVAGAMLLIAAGPKACVNRLLAARPLVAVGLVSYPLYLWHWPLLTYLRLLTSESPPPTWVFAALALAALLAWATHVWVERPIRFGRLAPRAPIVLAATAAVAAGIGWFTDASQGFESRIGAAQAAVNLRGEDYWKGWSVCSLVPSHGKDGGCFVVDAVAPPRVLLVGDSHAAHMAPGLRRVVGDWQNVAAIVQVGCLPVRHVPNGEKARVSCRGGLIEGALDLAGDLPTVHTVVLSGFVPLATTGRRLHHKSPKPGHDVDAHERAFETALALTFEQLDRKGKSIVYVLTVPELMNNPGKCTRDLLWATAYAPCQIDRAPVDARHQTYREAVARVAARYPAVTVLDPMAVLCDARHCQLGRPDLPYYKDRDHLTAEGSRYLMEGWTRLHGRLFVAPGQRADMRP